MQYDPSKFVLTDDLRRKAQEMPTFHVLFLSDGDGLHSGDRGLRMFDEMQKVYVRVANIAVRSCNSNALSMAMLEGVTHLWIDNVKEYALVQHIMRVLQECVTKHLPHREATETEWEQALAERKKELTIIYALDEFVWEMPAGRAASINSAMNVSTIIDAADLVVVPTVEMKMLIELHPVLIEPRDIAVLKTPLDYTKYPIFADHGARRKTGAMYTPKVLVKGTVIPPNVCEFIACSCEQMDIYISTVDNLPPDIVGLISSGKIKQAVHWANPQMTKGNRDLLLAMERDIGFDFAMHVRPYREQIKNYAVISEIALGDEDIMRSIAYGALPITNFKPEPGEESMYTGANTLFHSGLQFGEKDSGTDIRTLILSHIKGAEWGSAYRKAHEKLTPRLLNGKSLTFLAELFNVLIGPEMSLARDAIAKENLAKQTADAEAK